MITDDCPIRVLLIDDDEDDHVLTRDLLLDMVGYRPVVDWVATFQAGLEQICQAQHDVYLIDYQLGAENGLDLLRAAVCQGCRGPLILLTGQGDHDVDVEAMRAGAADYLVKNQISPRLLERSIRYSLERARTQEALRLSEERHRTLLYSLPQHVFFKDIDSVYLSINDSFASALGRRPEDIIGKTDQDLWPLEAAGRFRADDQRVLTARSSVMSEEVLTLNGQRRIMESIKAPVVADDNRVLGVLGLLTDITERKHLQSQVIRSDRLAAMGELVAGVAHEINNPLAAIIGNVELLGMHSDPRVREDAEIILRMADRVAQIVRSLLTFSRGQAAERRPETLNALVEDTLELAAYKLRRAAIVLDRQLPDLAPQVLVDGNQIQQIVLNLVSNAEHALRGTEGPKTITVRTGTREREGRAWATVSVTDNGCGIPEEARSRIFDPFFTTKGVGEGTGLGLSICHGIAEAHGGTLSVESAVGAGATFTLALPLASHSPQPAPA